MRGKKTLFLVFGIFVFLGAGCQKRGETPFSLPANAPPPQAQATPGAPLERDLPLTVFLIAQEQTPAWDAAGSIAGARVIGCNDYVVPVTVVVRGNPLAPLRAALTTLFTLTGDAAASRGYATALDESAMTVGDIARREDGAFVVDIRGTLQSAGVCDDPRIRAQIERTVAQYGAYQILLNGSETAWRCFGDQSGQCR